MGDKSGEVFKTLIQIDCSGHTEEKDGLLYLSWAWAWAEVKKHYPTANYKIWRDESGRPYIFDENLGYMVFVDVTIEDLTHTMWMTVMDSKNRAMKKEPYTITTKAGKKLTVRSATMFDINTALMRCLTKGLAMHGISLNLYAAGTNEILFDFETEEQRKAEEKRKKELLYGMDFQFIELAKLTGKDINEVRENTKKKYKMTGEFEDLSADNLQKVFDRTVEWIKLARGKNDENTGEN